VAWRRGRQPLRRELRARKPGGINVRQSTSKKARAKERLAEVRRLTTRLCSVRHTLQENRQDIPARPAASGRVLHDVAARDALGGHALYGRDCTRRPLPRRVVSALACRGRPQSLACSCSTRRQSTFASFQQLAKSIDKRRHPFRGASQHATANERVF
jgi:hypothetical protein